MHLPKAPLARVGRIAQSNPYVRCIRKIVYKLVQVDYGGPEDGLEEFV